MELVTPSNEYKDSFIQALKDGYYMGPNSGLSDKEIEDIEQNFDEYLAAKVLNKPDGTPKLRDDGKYYVNVPKVPFWLIDNDNFIGTFNLRAELNEFLMYVAGNVGYGVSPRYRRMGYATKGLGLLIEKAKEIGMKKLLVSAREDNVGSWKAIEKNGGVLENIITLPWDETKTPYKRYWIEIT